MATGLCQFFIACNHMRYQSLDACVAETDCRGVADLQSAVKSGTVGYDAGKAGECYANFMADPCGFGSSFLFTPNVFRVLAHCPGTLTPRQGPGQPCRDSRECTSGLDCQKAGSCPGICTAYVTEGGACNIEQSCASGLSCRNGRCEAPTYAKVGDACQNIGGCLWAGFTCPKDQICSQNLWCDLSVKQCKPGVLEGGTCGTIRNSGTGTPYFPTCAINLWCDSPSPLVMGTCHKKSAAGGSCVSVSSCQAGLRCEGRVSDPLHITYGTCVGPAGEGADCTFDSHCQAGLRCRDSKCSPPGGVGTSCSSDPDCAEGFFCHERKCATAHYVGSSCNDTDSFCAYSRCAAGTCTRFKTAGEACASSDECNSRLCQRDTGKCYDNSVCAP